MRMQWVLALLVMLAQRDVLGGRSGQIGGVRETLNQSWRIIARNPTETAIFGVILIAFLLGVWRWGKD